MLSLVPLIIGAGTVGIAHMAAPDHWVTLALLGRSKKWSRSKVIRTSLITSIGHVLLSIAMGVGVAAVGIAFSSLVSGYLDTSIGIIMVVTGLIVGIRPLVKDQSAYHRDLDQPAAKQPIDNGLTSRAGLKGNIGYFAVLGTALSPDPSIVPIFLASVPAGFYFLAELAGIFAATSVITLILLVQLGSKGFAKVFEKIPAKYNDSIVGFVIVAIGAFILVAGH